jgi:hypothetical protein
MTITVLTARDILVFIQGTSLPTSLGADWQDHSGQNFGRIIPKACSRDAAKNHGQSL